jgi:hypothetical protein
MSESRSRTPKTVGPRDRCRPRRAHSRRRWLLFRSGRLGRSRPRRRQRWMVRFARRIWETNRLNNDGHRFPRESHHEACYPACFLTKSQTSGAGLPGGRRQRLPHVGNPATDEVSRRRETHYKIFVANSTRQGHCFPSLSASWTRPGRILRWHKSDIATDAGVSLTQDRTLRRSTQSVAMIDEGQGRGLAHAVAATVSGSAHRMRAGDRRFSIAIPVVAVATRHRCGLRVDRRWCDSRNRSLLALLRCRSIWGGGWREPVSDQSLACDASSAAPADRRQDRGLARALHAHTGSPAAHGH